MSLFRSIVILLLTVVLIAMIFLIPHLESRRAFGGVLILLAAMLAVMYFGGKEYR